MIFGLLAFGVVLTLFLLVWVFAAEGAKAGEFKSDQFSAERAARLAWVQRNWETSQHVDTGGMDRVA